MAGTRGTHVGRHRPEDLQGGAASAPPCWPQSLLPSGLPCSPPQRPSDLFAHKSLLLPPRLQSPVVFTALRIGSKLHVCKAFRD